MVRLGFESVCHAPHSVIFFSPTMIKTAATIYTETCREYRISEVCSLKMLLWLKVRIFDLLQRNINKETHSGFRTPEPSVDSATWECPPSLTLSSPPAAASAWHCNKCVFNCSEANLSPKLMIMITLHEKSIWRGEPEEKRGEEGVCRGSTYVC